MARNLTVLDRQLHELWFGYPGVQPPRIRRARRCHRRMRWYLLTIPLTVMFASWLADGIEPARSWDDAMDVMKVNDRTRVMQLAALGVVIIGVVAVDRVIKRRRNRDKA